MVAGYDGQFLGITKLELGRWRLHDAKEWTVRVVPKDNPIVFGLQYEDRYNVYG
jgi:hypothetical protein